MTITASHEPTRPLWAVLGLVGGAGVLLAAADWWALRVAHLAEDPYENFGLGLAIIALGLLRSIALGVLVGRVTRNPGFVIGIVATVATPTVWSGIVGRLAGAVVPPGGQDAIVIPPWSFVLVLAWTICLLGFWGALWWPGQRWPVRIRNSTPFLLAIVGLGLFRVFGAI